MTNFEVALRTPLIIRAPWMKNSVGRVTSVLAEAVDFYPTLADLAGLPDPLTSAGQHLNGTSLLPVFVNPDETSVKSAAYSQFAKPYLNNPYSFWLVLCYSLFSLFFLSVCLSLFFSPSTAVRETQEENNHGGCACRLKPFSPCSPTLPFPVETSCSEISAFTPHIFC